MKLFAHRGWAQGAGENTLEAFARAAADPRLSGVEFDVRRGLTAETLLVTHDPPAVYMDEDLSSVLNAIKKIEDPADIDAQLVGWIKKSYSLTS